MPAEHVRTHGDAGIGQGEDRQHQVAGARRDVAQHAVRRGFQAIVDRIQRLQRRFGRSVTQLFAAVSRLCRQDRLGLYRERFEIRRWPRRDERGQDHAGEGGMQAAGVHADPERYAQQHVGRGAIDAGAVQQHECSGERDGRGQIAGLQVAGIEHGDDDDGADVIDDGGRGQEDAQLDRDARAQHRDQGHREGGIGRHGYAPAVRPGPRGNDERVEQRRHGHAADRCGDRQCRRAPGSQVADREFALDLQPDDEEEDRQQRVVDPVQQRHPETGGPERKAEIRMPEGLEAGAVAGIVEHDGQDRGQQQQHAGRGRPAREAQRGRAHTMSERAEHGVGEGAFVPRPVVVAPHRKRTHEGVP